MNSCRVSKKLKIPNSAHEFLDGGDFSDKKVISGFIHNTKKFWLACGPNLCVFNTKNGNKISRWTFGSALKDLSAKIVSIKELKSSHKETSVLVVGLEYNVFCGMVCLFDISSWKVLRAIQFVNKVTSLHVISSGDGSSLFPGPLNSFDGAIAVGILGGDVYIVDLCIGAIDEERNEHLCLHDEINACEINIIHIDKIDQIESLKQISERNQQHLAIHLNALISENSPHFVLKGPKGEDRVLVNKLEVCISALEYAPQLSSLLVGFNFGALQVWNLINMSLIYTSPVYEENIPISYFAIQEPVDDPRAFCYFWAVYSHSDQVPKSFPIAALYSLRFEYKDWHEGYGYIYKNLQSCCINFQVDLNNIDSNKDTQEAVSSRCIRLESFSKGTNKDAASTSFLESHENNFTLCLMVWNVCFKDQSSSTYLSIFDLNQWYKEQMPSRIQENQCVKYMVNICLSDVIYRDMCTNLPILNAQINPDTIVPFMATQKLEEIFYPSSLSFDCITISEQEIYTIKNCGYQKQFLNDLQSGGPLILIKPNELYERSMKLGFLPICMDNTPVTKNRVSLQEHILNIALEYKMTNWLFKCAFAWSNGSHRSAGLSLDFLLDWAWRRTNSLKSTCNKISALLFDCVQQKLDENTKILFCQCRSQILILKDLYCYICNNCADFLINEEVTKKQCECLNQMFAYLDVSSWMINIGLLPECTTTKKTNDDNRLMIPYLAEDIINFYSERRKHLNNINKTKDIFGENEAIMYIDKLIDVAGANAIKYEWKCDGGSGEYPPSSLQTILRTYLLDNVEIYDKHVIVSYFLLDIAMSLIKDKYQSIRPTLIKFPTIFNLTPTDVKIIQGVWQLDHGNFEIAVEQIIDPSIKSVDLPCWFHQFIIKILMLNNQTKLALIYLKTRNTPLNSISEVSTVIVLYVSNHMVLKALELQRQHSSQDETVLLQVLCDECVKQNQLQELINLTLTKTEEKFIMEFMETKNYPLKNKSKFVYYFQRNKFLHLYDMSNQNNPELMKHQLGSYGGMMNMVTNGLPVATKDTLNMCISERNNLIQKEPNPQPLSVFYHNKEENLKYKSNFLYACLKKAREAWTGSNAEKSNFLSDDDFPFLRSHHKLDNKRIKSRLIYPIQVRTFVKTSVSEDEILNPPKRIRLSPAKDFFNEDNSTNSIHLTKIMTPLVKRKSYRTNDSLLTPQSILKIRNKDEDTLNHISSETPHHTSKISNNTLNKHSFNNSHYDSTPCDKQVDGVPRKSLSRTSVVRFQDNQSSSISSLENSHHITKSPSITDTSSNKQASKNSSISDNFITPEVSFNTDSNTSIQTEIQEEMEIEENPSKIINIPNESSKINTSVESRKSYREDISSQTPIRQSPGYKISKNNETQKLDLNSPRPSRISGRKSLSRQVLENNTISKLLPSKDSNMTPKPVSSKDLAKTPKQLSSKDLTKTPKHLSSRVLNATPKETKKISTTEVSFSKIIKVVDEHISEQSAEFNSVVDKKIIESKEDGTENIVKESHNEIRTCVRTVAKSESDESDESIEIDINGSEINEKSIQMAKNEDLQMYTDVEVGNKSDESEEEEVIENSNQYLHDPKMNNFHLTEELVPNVVGPSENEIEYVKELASPQYTYHEKQDAENSDSVKHIYPEIEDRSAISENKIEDEMENPLNNTVILTDIDTSPEISEKSSSCSSESDPLNRAQIEIISIGSGSDETRDTQYSDKYSVQFSDDDDDDEQEASNSGADPEKAFLVPKDTCVDGVVITYSIDSSDSNEENYIFENKENENSTDSQRTIENIEIKEEDSTENSSEDNLPAGDDDNKESTVGNADLHKQGDKETQDDEIKNDLSQPKIVNKEISTPKPKGRPRKSIGKSESEYILTTPQRVTRRSLRSSSVDTPIEIPKDEIKPRRRSLRKSESTEIIPAESTSIGSKVTPVSKAKSLILSKDVKKKSSIRRKSLNLDAVAEEQEIKTLNDSSRRLTRSQKMLLEKSSTKSITGSTKSEDSIYKEESDQENLSSLEEYFDPIQLLNKEAFKGPKDLEENNFYENNSASNVINENDTSIPQSSKKGTKKRTAGKIVVDSPKPATKSTRKKSVDSVESVEGNELRRSTRSRSKSVCSDGLGADAKPDSTTSKRRGRPPKILKKITELENITEEVSEELTEMPASKKRRRAN